MDWGARGLAIALVAVKGEGESRLQSLDEKDPGLCLAGYESDTRVNMIVFIAMEEKEIQKSPTLERSQGRVLQRQTGGAGALHGGHLWTCPFFTLPCFLATSSLLRSFQSKYHMDDFSVLLQLQVTGRLTQSCLSK